MMGLLTTQSKVFVDTSVLFAAIGSPTGYARDLLVAGITGQCQLFISAYVLEEAHRTIARKRPAAVSLFQEFADLLTNRADPDKEQIVRVSQFTALTDRADVPIIAAALQAHANYLATYDRKHLLAIRENIRESFGFITATPQELLVP